MYKDHLVYKHHTLQQTLHTKIKFKPNYNKIQNTLFLKKFKRKGWSAVATQSQSLSTFRRERSRAALRSRP